MFMDAGLDTGDMLLKAEFPIGPDTTLEEVHDGLMELGAKVLIETLEALSAGTLKRIPQTGESNYAPMLTKETGHIHWTDPAKKIHDLVRGLDSWPGAYTFACKYKIWRTLHGGRRPRSRAPSCRPTERRSLCGSERWRAGSHGTQAPGKKRMAARDYPQRPCHRLPAQFED